MEQLLSLELDGVQIEGMLNIPEKARGIVIFAHGSGSSRFSPRNNYVAKVLQNNQIGTLLIDLLSKDEDQLYENRFNINLLVKRLIQIIAFLNKKKESQSLPLGLFGASTGAAAALDTAFLLGDKIKAIVSRGGRPDLAPKALPQVLSPTLIVVGGNDSGVIELNKAAYNCLTCKKKWIVIPGATHLFEEPGTLEQVAQEAVKWFKSYLAKNQP